LEETVSLGAIQAVLHSPKKTFVLLRLQQGEISLSRLAYEIGLNTEETLGIVDELCEMGFVEKTHSIWGQTHRNTQNPA